MTSTEKKLCVFIQPVATHRWKSLSPKIENTQRSCQLLFIETGSLEMTGNVSVTYKSYNHKLKLSDNTETPYLSHLPVGAVAPYERLFVSLL